MSDDEQHITDEEWADRFGWSVDDTNTANLLENTQTNRMLLARIGVQFVWSQQDRDDGEYEIVGGMTPNAIGFYLTDRPRSTPDDENVIGIIPPRRQRLRGGIRPSFFHSGKLTVQNGRNTFSTCDFASVWHSTIRAVNISATSSVMVMPYFASKRPRLTICCASTSAIILAKVI